MVTFGHLSVALSNACEIKEVCRQLLHIDSDLSTLHNDIRKLTAHIF
jgi:hypothetical protein